jgi:outer membrane protein TolC
MKRILLFSCAALLSFSLQAQTKPTHNAAQATPPANNASIKDRLVELAMSNPQYRIAGYQKDKTDYEVTKANASWLNYVTASVNINEVTTGMYKSGENGRANIYYPLWNVGINVPLGSLITKPADVKIAKKNRDIAEEQKEGLGRLIKRQVLSLYEDYQTKQDLLNMQSEITDDEAAAFATIEEKFAGGGISYQEYGIASKSLNDQQVKQKILQKEVNIIKLEIEEMIGVKLEEVLLMK